MSALTITRVAIMVLLAPIWVPFAIAGVCLLFTPWIVAWKVFRGDVEP